MKEEKKEQNFMLLIAKCTESHASFSSLYSVGLVVLCRNIYGIMKLVKHHEERNFKFYEWEVH